MADFEIKDMTKFIPTFSQLLTRRHRTQNRHPLFKA